VSRRPPSSTLRLLSSAKATRSKHTVERLTDHKTHTNLFLFHSRFDFDICLGSAEGERGDIRMLTRWDTFSKQDCLFGLHKVSEVTIGCSHVGTRCQVQVIAEDLSNLLEDFFFEKKRTEPMQSPHMRQYDGRVAQCNYRSFRTAWCRYIGGLSSNFEIVFASS
jgi:hypothetical protein